MTDFVLEWFLVHLWSRAPELRGSLRLRTWILTLRESSSVDRFATPTNALRPLLTRLVQRPIGIACAAVLLIDVDFEVGQNATIGPDPVFVAALWAVIATVVTVAAAVLVFVLQIYVGRTPGSSLRTLVGDSRLILFLYLGAVGLIVVGFDALTHQPIVAGTVVSLAILLSLLPVVIRSVKVVSEHSVGEQLLRSLATERERSRTAIAFETVASELLALRLQPLSIVRVRPNNEYVAVRLARSGFVYDIRLDQLAGVVASLGPGSGPAAIVVSLGSPLGIDNTIGYLPPNSRARARRAMLRCVVVMGSP